MKKEYETPQIEIFRFELEDGIMDMYWGQETETYINDITSEVESVTVWSPEF